MRQQPSGRRPRGRSNRKQFISPKSQTYDSHGPDVRVRGNAMQVYEKYMSLARDAASSGDRITAESFFQFAEHYYRILNDTTDPQRLGQMHERMRGTPAEPYPVNAEQPVVDQEGSGHLGKGNGQTHVGATDGSDQSAGGDQGGPRDGKAEETPDGAVPQAVAEVDATALPHDEAPAEAPTAEKTTRARGRPRARAKADNGSADSKSGQANGPIGDSTCGPSEV